jgi:predicted AAA+ superfamily ATPase
MQKLYEKSIRKVKGIKIDFIRYLFYEINWKDRLIGIKGARGAGKTTLLLQKLKKDSANHPESLYISMDDVYFSKNSLVDFVDLFVKNGGEVICIDEVHKYPNWSQEIKNIYDDYPNLQVVFTSSSALEIHKGDSDLSRRARIYHLNELSLREYIQLMYKKEFSAISMKDVLFHHTELSVLLTEQIKPVKLLKEYMQYGSYPFISEGKNKYYERIETVINLIIESDLPAITEIEYSTIVKLKKLIFILSESVPFKPNIAELSRKVSTSRDLLLKYLHYLERANLLKLLRRDTKGISQMSKPEKIYLNNPTLMHAISTDKVNEGNLRETFFMNQVNCKHHLTYPGKGDFKIDETYIIEVGGKNKSQEQISNLKNSFLAIDDIEYGYKNKIPLWLFGFLY